ncbi:hypothetical protein M405DRAFT_305305 [Rhizopogon salebrosus TDB-379]|nr:hypothetical protein M405DRAFT_305305 [Rhizopogon salebrosus TDB-379]
MHHYVQAATSRSLAFMKFSFPLLRTQQDIVSRFMQRITTFKLPPAVLWHS